MKLAYQQAGLRDIEADIAVIFIGEGKDAFAAGHAYARKFAGSKLDAIIELEDFKGKDGEMLSLYPDGRFPSPRLFLAGMGDAKKITPEKYRRAAATAAKKARSANVKHMVFDIASPVPGSTLDTVDIVRAVAEGAILSVYKYDKYLTDKKNKPLKLSTLTFAEPRGEKAKEIKKALAETKIVCEAVYFARNLSNGPGNEIYPESLAEAAKKSGEQYGFRVEAWDRDQIKAQGFGGLIAVNSGSDRPARFIIMEHNSGRSELDTIVLVGKGITFDSGGISIKPSAGMAEMKMDMSGAAAVIATMEAVARLNIPLHVIGLVPSAENMPSGTSMRPGDIITHYNGKTSEVDNTDAEGRLVLADALAYADTFKPAAVIDLATLTGACVVALGSHAAGMMGNDDAVMAQLESAGNKSFERVWELPLFEEYEKQIKSDVADVKNVGGRWGGAITAGLFLKRFIGTYRWVHLDIAGPAILEEDHPYTPRGGSGFGVRLLVEFLEHWDGTQQANGDTGSRA